MWAAIPLWKSCAVAGKTTGDTSAKPMAIRLSMAASSLRTTTRILNTQKDDFDRRVDVRFGPKKADVDSKRPDV